MLERIRTRITRALDRCNDKAQKFLVYKELNTFAQESWMFRDKQTHIRHVYRAALADPLNFRKVLNRAHAREYTLLRGDGELPVTVAEERYYKKRGMEVPPLF